MLCANLSFCDNIYVCIFVRYICVPLSCSVSKNDEAGRQVVFLNEGALSIMICGKVGVRLHIQALASLHVPLLKTFLQP